MMLPVVSIVVPAYNEEEMLPSCLESLVNIDYPKEILEIIVVDNGSTDRSADIIKAFPVTYLLERKKGRSSARNAGIRKARGEIVAFTDADCIVDRDWIKNLVKEFEKPNVGCCGGRTHIYKPDNWMQKAAEEAQMLKYNSVHGVKFNIMEEYFFGESLLETCNMACRKRLVEEAGLFDERLVYAEDVDLSWRINFMGYQLSCAGDAVVYHKHMDTLFEYFSVMCGYMHSNYLILHKYANTILGRHSRPDIKEHAKLAVLSVKQVFAVILMTIPEIFRKGRRYRVYGNILNIVWILATVCGYSLYRCKGGLRESMDNCKPERALEKILWKWDVNKDVVVMNTGTNCFYRLTGAAGRIWELYRAGKDENEIVMSIVSEFDIGEAAARQDVGQMLDGFRSESIAK